MNSSLNTSKLHNALKKHASLSQKRFETHHPDAASFLSHIGLSPGALRHHAKKIAATGALAGMLLANPLTPKVSSVGSALINTSPSHLRHLFAANLKALLPGAVRPLTPEEEQTISKLIEIVWGIHASATLNGEHLNTSYGYIGAEQHLPRYPGDTIEQHDEYRDSGITPGKGAWGYFANSVEEMTQDLTEKEKYYVAVQTLYLPDWEKRLPYLREWYKYRKVLVVNPANGKAIVADIADSGPSNWTGKQFGGSPEVMGYLEMHDGAQKGAVVLFFLNDPKNSLRLGPLEYNIARTQSVAMKK